MELKNKKKLAGVETYEYKLFDGNVPVGEIQIRKAPTYGKGVPKDFASHIYYEIYPGYRNRGYGKKILELGIIEAKKLGLKELVITTLEDNIASKKIIENNGGVFLERKKDSKGEYMLKYSVRLD